MTVCTAHINCETGFPMSSSSKCECTNAKAAVSINEVLVCSWVGLSYAMVSCPLARTVHNGAWDRRLDIAGETMQQNHRNQKHTYVCTFGQKKVRLAVMRQYSVCFSASFTPTAPKCTHRCAVVCTNLWTSWSLYSKNPCDSVATWHTITMHVSRLPNLLYVHCILSQYR